MEDLHLKLQSYHVVHCVVELHGGSDQRTAIYNFRNQDFCPVLTYTRPSAINRHELLEKKHSILRRSDESAWTIVQSRPSTVRSSLRRRQSAESSEYFYHEFSFDDQLFTARVYKRNYGSIGVERNQISSRLEQQNNENLSSQLEQIRDTDETQSVQVPVTPSVSSIERNETCIHYPDFSDIETIRSMHTMDTNSSHHTSTAQRSYENSTHAPDSNL